MQCGIPAEVRVAEEVYVWAQRGHAACQGLRAGYPRQQREVQEPLLGQQLLHPPSDPRPHAVVLT